MDPHEPPPIPGDRVNQKLMAAELRATGFEVTAGVGGTGVVALMKNAAGPTMMIPAGS